MAGGRRPLYQEAMQWYLSCIVQVVQVVMAGLEMKEAEWKASGRLMRDLSLIWQAKEEARARARSFCLIPDKTQSVVEGCGDWRGCSWETMKGFIFVFNLAAPVSSQSSGWLVQGEGPDLHHWCVTESLTFWGWDLGESQYGCCGFRDRQVHGEAG